MYLTENNNSVNVNDPDYKYGLNFATLFLKPTTQLSGATERFYIASTLPSWKNVSINPTYHFAFDLGAKLVIRSKETVLKGNWEHFLASDGSGKTYNVTNSVNTLNTSSIISPTEYPSVPYTNASGLASYQRDKLNVLYGQLVDFGESLKVGLYAGASFTRLHVQTQQTYATNDIKGSAINSSQINTISSFSGVGPEFQLDLGYHLHKGLSFVLNETVDFLTGTEKTHTSFITSHTSLSTRPLTQNLVGRGQLEIVPVFSQKIGMQYELPFRDHCECQFEIGYYSQLYLDALFINEYIGFENDTGIVTNVTNHNRMSNFGLNGPYFKIDMAF